jgi:hypothetical protein
MLTYYEYAALSKTPRAWADDLILVFQHPGWKWKKLGITLRPRDCPLEDFR